MVRGIEEMVSSVLLVWPIQSAVSHETCRPSRAVPRFDLIDRSMVSVDTSRRGRGYAAVSDWGDACSHTKQASETLGSMDDS
jgi:hypothetical protein